MRERIVEVRRTLIEASHVYRFYFGVYVRSVGPITPIYMTVIDPVRKLIVYPSLLPQYPRRLGSAFGRG